MKGGGLKAHECKCARQRKRFECMMDADLLLNPRFCHSPSALCAASGSTPIYLYMSSNKLLLIKHQKSGLYQLHLSLLSVHPSEGWFCKALSHGSRRSIVTKKDL